MGEKVTISKVVEIIKGCKNPLIVSHFNPDSDAYGSSIGLYKALLDFGKEATCINQTTVVPYFEFMPLIQEVQNQLPKNILEHDILIFLDCGDEKRVGDDFGAKLMSHPNILNIDHHISNNFFGHYNLVISEASSTSEIVYEILSELGAPISKDVATVLLSGIYGDTGSFRYRSTTARTFLIASKLLEAGAMPDDISNNLYGRRSQSSIKVLAYGLANIKFYSEGKIAALTIIQDVFDELSATIHDTEGLVEELRSIEGVVVSVLCYRDNDLWKVSLRSKSSSVDLSAVAKEFGGGGHKAAAAFRWRKDYDELYTALIKRIEGAIASA